MLPRINFALPPMNVLFFAFLIIFALLPSSLSTLEITAQITDGDVVTLSEVDGALSVPNNARLLLNCSNPNGNTVDWLTTASQSPLVTILTGHALVRISSFGPENTGDYTCTSGGEVKIIFVSLDRIFILPNPENYDAYESDVVTLSVCVSAYPSLKNSLAVTFSNQGVSLSGCSQSNVGCFQCQVTVSDFSTVLNYSVEAISQGHQSTKLLFVTVHKTPRVVSSLPPTTIALQCRNIGLMCVGTGDPTLSVEWRHTPDNSPSTIVSSGGNYLIETVTALNAEDGQYYTSSILSIRPVDLWADGRYTCSFIGYAGRTDSISTQLDVTAQLCLQRMISNNEYANIPGNSVQVLETGQGSQVFLCFGDEVSWYQNGVSVPYSSADVYQAVDFGGLFIKALPESSYFYCESGTSSTQTWIYATTSTPTVITRPSGHLYHLKGGSVSIHAFHTQPEGAYTLDWFYMADGVKRNVTEFGWSINQLGDVDHDYFEVSISVPSLQQLHSGVIGVDYSVGGQVASAQVSLFLLPPPEPILSPSQSLKVWEGSDIEVKCLLKNETLPVTVDPHWTGVPTCPSQTEVCSADSNLRLSNLSVSSNGTYICSVENAAGEGNTSLQVSVRPLSPQLLLLSVLTPDTTYNVSAAVGSLYINTSEGTILLSCSLDNSLYSTFYLNATTNWTYPHSYAYAVSVNNTRLTIDPESIISFHQGPFNSSFCCLAQIDTFRRTQKCLTVTFDIPAAPSTFPTYPPTATTHIVIFLSVENCTLLPSLDPLVPIRRSLLDATRAQCSCNISDTELHLFHYSCHTDLISNSPRHLLTLCGASTYSLYQLLISDSLVQLNISLDSSYLVISSVSNSHTGTHCDLNPPTNSTTPPPNTSLELPLWIQVVIYGAFPILLLVLIIVVTLIISYICYNILCKYRRKSRSFAVEEDPQGTELPEALQTLVQSDRHLISTQVTLSPSQVPRTFKSAAPATYSPDTPPPRELISRLASSPPNQGEFPVMYSNPLAFDGSGEYSTSSFTNFNNNRNYSSDMIPLETDARYVATHRVYLNRWPATAAAIATRSSISRDYAHASLPSPLRSARRYATQCRLSQNRKWPPNPANPHHQLKIRHPPPPPSAAKISRYETPTFDSGVEEMESTHPRSSSASSYSEVSDDPPVKTRASSLSTSFPQHSLHVKMHSYELERNNSLPNILESSPGPKLELYRTVKRDQWGSQTLV